MQRHNRIVGFSLIELMIAVAIVGILAAIAYPSYREQMLRTHRSDGQAALLDTAQKLETFFVNNGTYTTSLDVINASATSTEGFYTLEVTGCPIANCYTVTAKPTAQGGQNSDSVTWFSLDSRGLRQREEDGNTELGW